MGWGGAVPVRFATRSGSASRGELRCGASRCSTGQAVLDERQGGKACPEALTDSRSMIFATQVGNATIALPPVNRVEAEAEIRQQKEAPHGSWRGCARLNIALISSTACHRSVPTTPARRFLARSGNAQPFRAQGESFTRIVTGPIHSAIPRFTLSRRSEDSGLSTFPHGARRLQPPTSGAGRAARNQRAETRFTPGTRAHQARATPHPESQPRTGRPGHLLWRTFEGCGNDSAHCRNASCSFVFPW
jgi:hypothetical protein